MSWLALLSSRDWPRTAIGEHANAAAKSNVTDNLFLVICEIFLLERICSLNLQIAGRKAPVAVLIELIGHPIRIKNEVPDLNSNSL